LTPLAVAQGTPLRGVTVHDGVPLQVDVAHTVVDWHVTGMPGEQAPDPLQLSPHVQGLPSSQGAPFGTYWGTQFPESSHLPWLVHGPPGPPALQKAPAMV
jgi:hypothetical protein